jgi:hypothetical protein
LYGTTGAGSERNIYRSATLLPPLFSPELSSNGELLGGSQLHPAVGELLPGGGRRMAKGGGGEWRGVVAAATTAAVVAGVAAATAVTVVEGAAVSPAQDITDKGAVRRVASTEELRN